MDIAVAVSYINRTQEQFGTQTGETIQQRVCVCAYMCLCSLLDDSDLMRVLLCVPTAELTDGFLY